MHPVLSQNLFLVKEQVGMFRAANNYDIFDPHSGQQILLCREPNLGFFTKLLRFTNLKRATPFDVEIRTPEGQLVLRITRGVSLFVSEVAVRDHENERIGYFKQKVFSLRSRFNVFGDNGELLCELTGKWTDWDFRFQRDGVQFATVTKKWDGLGRELFTSADNYVLSIEDFVPATNPIRMLILAAVICIDRVLHE